LSYVNDIISTYPNYSYVNTIQLILSFVQIKDIWLFQILI